MVYLCLQVNDCVEQDKQGSLILKEEVGVVLQNRLTTVADQVKQRMIIASMMLDFHRNLKNVSFQLLLECCGCG